MTNFEIKVHTKTITDLVKQELKACGDEYSDEYIENMAMSFFDTLFSDAEEYFCSQIVNQCYSISEQAH